ncbi:MAG: hydroxymethylpyrimidine/phosphomethylpyrimidine kinase [Gammaproteobacteria bacterium]|nr:hydroxymethylpyrimidine/phosphomethylpyrimidine kinase [Gammaproteobacteria bacterium]
MLTVQQKVPPIMVFAGLDPTGGAGLQADIESIASLGGHALPVITTITVQDTRGVKRFSAVEGLTVIEQARAVLEDIDAAAFKIGVTGSVENIETIHSILRDFPGRPVVVDPVCASSGGQPFMDEEQLDAMVSLLIPQATVVTPNIPEARLLAPEADSVNAIAQQILSYGCQYVLITGTHEPAAEPKVTNRLFSDLRLVQEYTCERLPYDYHGSGCTLASAIATLLAHGVEPQVAVGEAIHFTVESLRGARRLGAGQMLPDRLHWAREQPIE